MGNLSSSFESKLKNRNQIIKSFGAYNAIPTDIINIIIKYDWNFEGVIYKVLGGYFYGHNDFIKNISCYPLPTDILESHQNYNIISHDALGKTIIWNSDGEHIKTIDISKYLGIVMELLFCKFCYINNDLLAFVPKFDNIITLFDFKKKTTQTLIGHNSEITCVINISSDKIISGSYDHDIRIWNTNNCKCETILTGHYGIVYCLLLLKNDILVSGSNDGTMRFWDIENKKCIETIEYKNNSIFNSIREIKCLLIETHRNNDLIIYTYRIAFLQNNKIKIINLNINIDTLHNCNIEITDKNPTIEITNGDDSIEHNIEFLSDSNIICTGYSNALKIYNSITGICEGKYVGHKDRISNIIRLPDGKIASSSYDGQIILWY